MGGFAFTYAPSQVLLRLVRAALLHLLSEKKSLLEDYNNWDFNVLGTILEHSAGHSLFEEFEQRIVIPLQMQDYSLQKQSYEYEPVSQHPAYVFRLSARDVARFGLLFLRRGDWQGKSLLSAKWVSAQFGTLLALLLEACPQP